MKKDIKKGESWRKGYQAGVEEARNKMKEFTQKWRERFDEEFDFFECAALNGLEIKDFISQVEKEAHTKGVVETEKAFGGCKLCYGKGYATQKVQARRRSYKWELNPIKPCSCERGKQIKEILSKSKGISL